jgi:hypothetical protein
MAAQDNVDAGVADCQIPDRELVQAGGQLGCWRSQRFQPAVTLSSIIAVAVSVSIQLQQAVFFLPPSNLSELPMQSELIEQGSAG